MKLSTSMFQELLIIEEHKPLELVIENQRLMLQFLKDLYAQTIGLPGDIILSKKNSRISIAKSVELISTFLPFEINEKRLISKIYSILEKEAINEIHYNETMGLLSKIEQFMDELAFTLPFTVEYSGLNVLALIKMCGLQLVDDSQSEIEKVINHMELIEYLLGEKLFIFVNMRSFFNDLDMQNFVDTVSMRKYQTLFIEGREYPLLQGVERLIIDHDLCII